MAAGIHLQQHAFLGVAVTTATMFGSPSSARRRNACREQNPAHSRPRQLDAFVLGQHLAQVLLIETQVLVFGQLDHSGSGGCINRVVGSSTPVAVDEAGHSAFGVGLVKTLKLPLGDAEKLGRLGVDQRS